MWADRDDEGMDQHRQIGASRGTRPMRYSAIELLDGSVEGLGGRWMRRSGRQAASLRDSTPVFYNSARQERS
jgi:hypothetical protein